MATSTSTPPISSIPLSTVLTPSFSGVPTAKELVSFFLKAVVYIHRHKLPVKLYVTPDVAEKLSPLLKKIGITFRTVSRNQMTPPYIFISSDNGDIVVTTADEGGKILASFRAPSRRFIEELEKAVMAIRKRRKKTQPIPQYVEEAVVDEKLLEKLIDFIPFDEDK